MTVHAIASHKAATHDRNPPAVRVRAATSIADIEQAAAIRHAAYTRRGATWAHVLAAPEPSDLDGPAVVLLAEPMIDDRDAAAPVGTMRIHGNAHAPLPLEASVTLPARLQGRRLAEATRLAVASPDADVSRAARDALFRACWRHLMRHGVEWLVVVARSPLDRLYEGLFFDDVFEPGSWYPMRHVGNLPHRVMALSIPGALSRWTAHRHPLLGFMLQGLRDDESSTGAARAAAR